MKITLSNIIKKYGEFPAINSVNLDLNSGEMLGLVGPNGSGKTTLLKLILGILKPTQGQIQVDGQILDPATWKEYKRRVGYMPERVSFYDNLTGMETLKFFGEIKDGSIDNIKDVLDRLFTKEILDKKVGSYSKGMRQRLNFAQAIINDPSVLILDEPTSGLDPIGIKEFYDIISGILARKKPIIILSSHILAEIEDRVTKVGIMKEGILQALGTLNELYKISDLPLKLYIMLNSRGSTPIESRGSTPIDSRGSTPIDSRGSTPIDSQGSTPIDSQGSTTINSQGSTPVKSENNAIIDMLNREGVKIIMSTENDIHCEFHRDKKMKILSCLMELRIDVSDFIVREPSLEEVFFGLN